MKVNAHASAAGAIDMCGASVVQRGRRIRGQPMRHVPGTGRITCMAAYSLRQNLLMLGAGRSAAAGR